MHRTNRYQTYFLLTLFFISLFACASPALLTPFAPTKPEQAHNADSFIDSIGVATHLRYLDTAYGNYSSIVKPKLHELGIHHIRDGFGPKDREIQRKLNDLATIGVKSTLVMDPRNGLKPSDAVAIAKTVADSIEAVEGPNEWDIHPELTYESQAFPNGVSRFQNELYSAIKGDPATAHLPVLGPSVARPKNTTKLKKLACDFGNMHSYAGGGLPSKGLDSTYIPMARKMCGLKPVIATESGWHNAKDNIKGSHRGISELASAKYIPRLYLEYFNRGVVRTYNYEFIDEGTDQTNREKNFGLLRNDGSPKPAFTALKNLISLLKDPGSSFAPGFLDYTLSGNTSEVHKTLLQKRDGRFFLILWLEKPCYDLEKKKDLIVPEQSVTLKLNSSIKKIAIYKPITRVTPVRLHTKLKRLKLKIPDHPLVIELEPT